MPLLVLPLDGNIAPAGHAVTVGELGRGEAKEAAGQHLDDIAWLTTPLLGEMPSKPATGVILRGGNGAGPHCGLQEHLVGDAGDHHMSNSRKHRREFLVAGQHCFGIVPERKRQGTNGRHGPCLLRYVVNTFPWTRI